MCSWILWIINDNSHPLIFGHFTIFVMMFSQLDEDGMTWNLIHRNPYPTKIMMKTTLEPFTLKQRIMAVFNNFWVKIVFDGCITRRRSRWHAIWWCSDVMKLRNHHFLIFGNLKGWRECKGCVCWVKKGKGLWQFVFFKFFVCFDSRCSSSHVGGRNRMMLFITRLNVSMNDTDL